MTNNQPPTKANPMFQQLLNQAQIAQRRYLQMGNLSALDESIVAWERVLQHPEFVTVTEEFRLGVLNDCAITYWRRYKARGELSDLDHALSTWQTLVTTTPLESPYLPILLNNLGNGLGNRYARTGDLSDLQTGIATSQQAVQLTPAGSPDLPGYLNNLGNSLRNRYARTGDLSDFQTGIEAYQQAVQLTPVESPDLPGYLNNLGNGLRDRYTREGDISDLQAAIEAYQQVVQLTPAGSPDLSGILNNLGNGLRDRYARTGDLSDLQAAIEAYQQAKGLTPVGSPYLPTLLNNLGNGLGDRYARTGDLSDLQAGIAAYQQTVHLTFARSPDLPCRLSNLGLGLGDRYNRTGNLSDLQKSIEAYQRARDLTPTGSPDLPSRLNNLGNGLRDRYARTGNVSDLQSGIEAYQQAKDLTPVGSPDLPGILNNLGNGLRDHYARTGNLTDLHAGIAAFQRARDLTPTGSPDLPMYLNNLGTGFQVRYARTRDLTDLQAGIENYQQAAQRGLDVATGIALTSAGNWLRLVFSRQSWQEVTEAYYYAYEAGQRLLKVQLLRTHKESWLKDMQGLASQAAYAFIKLNQPQEAVVTLERGIAILLSEALQRDRANLEQLKTTGHIDLYDRYQEIVDRYHWAQLQQDVEASKTAQADLDKTIEDIRQVPGYEDFLKPVKFDLIQAAAQETPLVYLLTTSAGGLALIVKQEKITPVWLPNLEDTFAGYWEAYIQWRNTPTNDNLRHHWHTTIETTTQQLWTAVIQPVINALPPHTHHLTLIPVGRLNLLPWHAAWTEDTTSRCYALNKLTIAYAPNAVTVTQCQQWAKPTTVPKLLAISEPHPQPNQDLEDSLHYSRYATPAICSLFPDNTQQLARGQATVAGVTAQLREAHNLWYFYCHGLTNFEEPLKSGLLLAGSQPQFLTLGDVLNLKVTGVRLATLAACETNIPDLHKLPDEVVSLAAGLLQAGVAGVIASLWSVNALSTAFLMVRCYELLHQRWQTDGNMQAPLVFALQEAQRWLRDSTKRELQEWVEKKQIRQHLELHQQTELDDLLWYEEAKAKADEERPFAEPYYWAAFVAMGH